MLKQIIQTTKKTNDWGKAQFSKMIEGTLKGLLFLMVFIFSASAFAQDFYIATADLNLRSGAGKNYKSLVVLSKGDTIQLIDNTGNYWVKIQYQDKIGYSSKQFLQKIQIQEAVQQEAVPEESEGNSYPFLIGIVVLILVAIILTKSGKKHRNIFLLKILSFFFGTFGFQKYYLGQTNKGTLSILFCWTFIPTIIGLIDFIKLASMSVENFNIEYNGSIATQKQTKKETENKVSTNTNTRNKKVESASGKYAAILYKKGLYIDEILNRLIDEDYKMPNGEAITNFNQVKILIRSRIPNANFEVKPKIKTSKKLEKKEISNLAYEKKTNDSESKRVETKKDNRESVDEEIKKIAEREYPKDLFVQEHTYKQQAESKSFMANATDVEISRYAKKEYPNDYFMQEHTYKQQIKSRSYMTKTDDKEIRKYAEGEYPRDFFMQEHTYKQQIESKSYIAKTADKEVRKYAEREYPRDYFMQKHIYNEQIALASHKRQTVNKQPDETIIDINAENFDLTIEQPITQKENPLEPPIWSHSYVYSYDELNYATKAQRKFYFHFRRKILNNEFVDIKGNTNYAFILYFDLLNEYENHRDIKLLEEQFKLLGKICPKTKSYSLMSIQDLLRKRTDSYSVDKLTSLQEPNYQFEHGYSDYEPDAYKLGKQYKDKLELNKQEVAWLNKFWNPSNVFISIEGCCIATMKQYLLIIKSLNKKLKIQNTSVAKEVDFFKEKIFEIKEIADSHWGVYDKSYLKQRVESEIYLAIFKRVENSVRESFGHKRKVGSTPYYDFKGEFETRIGNYVDELVLKYQNDIEHPDLETQIELNAQNVNRWKIDFNNLKNSFQKEDKIKFIDGIINLEETNQKNPNIENIFFEASKFISKFDNVQSLKYYAKYIYYDLKSKKFDNKELTRTVQKSLFKTDEQINDFKRIIAELIESPDIKKALDEIAKIYIPKRKKIKLDKSVIKEVEQKHDGTVELLSEYLETEDKETVESEIENEEIGISVIPTKTNNSIFISEITIGKTQEELIKKIVSNSFEIHQNEVDKFATENGFFKNQLIDSINEACEEHLEGEALIEEDEENYVIEESYYKEIAV